MFQHAAATADQALDWVNADPYAVRFAAVGAKGDLDEALRLAIRLPAPRAASSAETFVLSLMAASSRRTLWTLRRAPTYWRIAPLDIPVFRLCQRTMASLRTAKARAEWLIAPPFAAASLGLALYFQQAPDAPFVMLSSAVAWLAEESLLSCVD